MSVRERIVGEESLVGIACCQMEPRVGELEDNLEKTICFTERAAKSGARLIIIPELSVSGYIFNTRKEAFRYSEILPGGDSIKA
jgi:predicted amidohydrolase